MSVFIPARKLTIKHADDPENWKWSHHHGSSLEEVVELLQVWWLEIRAFVKTKELDKASYSAYLVFKIEDSSQNVEKATASVRFTTEITDWELEEGYIVFLNKRRNDPSEKGRFPQVRNDGWMEIKLGEFSNFFDDGELEIGVREYNTSKRKSGLVIRGIDLRPIPQKVDAAVTAPEKSHRCIRMRRLFSFMFGLKLKIEKQED